MHMTMLYLPTVLVDGVDIEPEARNRTDYNYKYLYKIVFIHFGAECAGCGANACLPKEKI